MQSLACCTLQKSRNCSPADADVIHYTEDKFKTVVGSDLLLCLIVLKTNAMQSALCSTLSIYLKVTTAQICLVKFLCRKDFLVCSLKTKEKRNGHTWDLIEGGTVLYLFQHILFESQLFIFNICTWFLMLITVENDKNLSHREHAVLNMSLPSEVKGKS